MDRSTAEALMKAYTRIGAALGDADALVRAVPDPSERDLHLRALGTLMQDLWLVLMAPIVREHPGLDPDRKRSP